MSGTETGGAGPRPPSLPAGAAFVVTGAGGWLGRAALELLDRTFDAVAGGRVFAYAASARTLRLRSGRTLDCLPLDAIDALPVSAPYFLHCAFLTRDRVAAMPLDAYVAANRRISETVVEAIETRGAGGLFLPSSGAVYRRDRTLDTRLAENPYGVLKHEDEERFGALAARRGIPLATIRIFNLAGPFINKRGSYALSSILDDIAAGGPIRLRADKPVLRSYVHVEDVLRVALALVARGGDPAPFDTAGELAIEVGDLARRAAMLLGRDDMAIERPPLSGAEPDRYVGDATRFAVLAAAGGVPLRPLDAQILDTAAYLRSA